MIRADGKPPDFHVLCVENEPLVRNVLSEQLRFLGYDSTAVDSVHKAREVLSSLHVDLILLDLYLPDLSGAAAVRKIRELDPTTPIVVSSGLALQSRTELAGEAVDGFLDKPFDLHQLRDLLIRFLPI